MIKDEEDTGLKLYQLSRKTKFTINEDGLRDREYTLITLDGMYSVCLDEDDNVAHWSTMTPVKEVI